MKEKLGGVAHLSGGISKIRLWPLPTFALACGLSSVAQAQDASTPPAKPAEAVTTQDIIVTAQFRKQRLQDTPIAITAIGGAALEARGFSNVTDLTQAAPNVNIRPGGSSFGPAAQSFIRGIGQFDSGIGLEPGVGMYVDDVYYGSLLGSIFDLVDLDRVEVLRGPQGTLAGKNSIGGAIRLYSRRPEGSGTGYLQADYGAYDRIEVKGSADLAIVPDRLFLRISGLGKRRDGYLTRLDYGCANPGRGVAPIGNANRDCEIGTEGGFNVAAGRAALRWIASPDIEINLIGSLTVENSEPAPNKLLVNSAIANLPAGVTGSQFVTGPRSYTNYATYSAAAFTDARGPHPAIAVEPEVNTRARTISGTIDWHLGNRLSLTSITAYQHFSGDFVNDFDVTPFTGNLVQTTYDNRQFTQELRLNGVIGDLADYTLGGFYFDADNKVGGLTLFNPGFIGAPGNPPQNVYLVDDRLTSRSVSGFAHATIHITPKLNLNAGLRYTDDEKSYRFGRRNPFDPATTAYNSARLIDGATGGFKGTRWDYRINMDYHWTRDVMTYAQISTGYRGGGTNPRPFAADQIVPYAPETLTAYEVGVKAAFLDRAVQLNISAFLNKYKDLVVTNIAPTPTSLINATPINAGNADIRGFEVELNARPLAGLSIDTSLSYLDFSLTSIGRAGATIRGITLANRPPYAPEWKASVGIQYAVPLSNGATLTPRADLSYQSKFFTNLDNNPLGLVDGYEIVNLRLAYESADRDWMIAGSVSNLLDRFYYLNKTVTPVGFTTGQPAVPREWKISIRRAF